MDHSIIVGLIVGLTVASVGGVTLASWLSWRKEEPHEFYKGVGLIYTDGALRPWPGLELAIDMLQSDLALRWPKNPELLSFWIRVFPPSGIISTKESPSGFVRPKTFMPAPAPKDRDSALEVMKVGGTVKVERLMGLFKKHYVVELLQRRRFGAEWEHRLGLGTGPVVWMGESTLFHEVIEHAVSMQLWGSDNRGHVRPDLTAAVDELEKKYKRLANG